MRPYSAFLLLLAGCTPCGLADPVHHTWFVGGGSVTVALTAEEAGAVEGTFTVEGSTAEELAAEELGSGEGAWMRAEEQDVPAGSSASACSPSWAPSRPRASTAGRRS